MLSPIAIFLFDTLYKKVDSRITINKGVSDNLIHPY